MDQSFTCQSTDSPMFGLFKRKKKEQPSDRDPSLDEIERESDSALDELPVDTPREDLAVEARRPEDDALEAASAESAAPDSEAAERQVEPDEQMEPDEQVEVPTSVASESQRDVGEVDSTPPAIEPSGFAVADETPPADSATAGRDKPSGAKRGWLARIKAGLGKTRANLTLSLIHI